MGQFVSTWPGVRSLLLHDWVVGVIGISDSHLPIHLVVHHHFHAHGTTSVEAHAHWQLILHLDARHLHHAVHVICTLTVLELSFELA